MGSNRKRTLGAADSDFAAMVEARKQAEAEQSGREARAIAAHFDPATGDICVRLSRGSRLMVPHELIEGLAGASTEALAIIEVMPAGTGISWPQLEVDVSVPGLAMEVFGSRTWMRELAKRAGSATSLAKAAAARANGNKGGRPRGKREALRLDASD